MPNRIIKESALTSRSLNGCSPEAERLFWRLILIADDFGRFDAEPVVVRSRCFPLLADAIKSNQVDKWIIELAQFDLVRLYFIEQNKYGFFPAWEKHQQKRALKSKYPEPLADAIICKQMQSNVLVSETEIVLRDRDRDRHSQPLSLASGFGEFWTLYPKKKSKGDAEKAWKSIKPDSDLKVKILEALRFWIRTPDWTKDSGQYVPHPATWLRAKGWEDDKASVSSGNGKGRVQGQELAVSQVPAYRPPKLKPDEVRGSPETLAKLRGLVDGLGKKMEM